MPAASRPATRTDQFALRWNEREPVTMSAFVPYLRAVAGSLASAPGPNSMRGMREIEKSLINKKYSSASKNLIFIANGNCLLFERLWRA
jgi:hypothetical protein